MRQKLNKVITDEPAPVTGRVQHYSFALGAPADGDLEEIWIEGELIARSPEKARKKARRIQLKTGWPLIRFDPQPKLIKVVTEAETGPRARWSRAHHRWQHFMDGRWA